MTGGPPGSGITMPRVLGVTTTWNIDTSSDDVGGSNRILPVTVAGFNDIRTTPLTSSPPTVTVAARVSRDPPVGSFGSIARSMYEPGATPEIVNVPSGLIWPVAGRMTNVGSLDWSIAMTKPLLRGWPRESSVVPLMRTVRVGANMISIPDAV